MVPDLPMFDVVPYGYDLSHSAVGLVTVDPVAGSVVVLLWLLLVRGALVSAGPAWLRARLPDSRLTRREWLLVPVAAAVGAATHVGWDALTHEGRWGDRHIPWLHDDLFGHAGYHWAQAASSVLGLVVLAVYGAVVVTRRAPTRPVAAPGGAHVARWSLAAVTAGTVGVALVAAVATLGEGLHAAAFSAAERGLTVLIVGLLLAGGAWRLAADRA